MKKLRPAGVYRTPKCVWCWDLASPWTGLSHLSVAWTEEECKGGLRYILEE